MYYLPFVIHAYFLGVSHGMICMSPIWPITTQYPVESSSLSPSGGVKSVEGAVPSLNIQALSSPERVRPIQTGPVFLWKCVKLYQTTQRWDKILFSPKHKETVCSGGSKGGARDVPPPGPKFLHFHAVFGKNWPNNRLAPPFGVSAPSSGKSWIRHWYEYTENDFTWKRCSLRFQLFQDVQFIIITKSRQMSSKSFVTLSFSSGEVQCDVLDTETSISIQLVIFWAKRCCLYIQNVKM